MTLPQARVILENYLAQLENCEPSLHTPEGLAEAIRMAVATLPRPVSVKTAAERLAEIREAISSRTGIDPFEGRSRDAGIAAWRHCVFRMMMVEGYHSTDIGRASGYDHATVLWGNWRVRRARLNTDPIAAETWGEAVSIIGGGG